MIFFFFFAYCNLIMLSYFYWANSFFTSRGLMNSVIDWKERQDKAIVQA